MVGGVFHRSSRKVGAAFLCTSSGGCPTPPTFRSCSRIRSRGVVRFDGPDSLSFLQGLVSNDVSKLPQSPSPSSSLYTAILNPQGRFLFDMFLYPTAAPDSLLGDVHAPSLDDLVSHFNRYRLRAKVKISDVSSEMSVWQCYGSCLAGEDLATKKNAEGGSTGLGWKWYNDPRISVLGLRGLFPSDIVPPCVEACKEVDEEYFLRLRLEQGIAEGCTEISQGEAIPLEYNLAGLNAISFNKGCYVGQELIARTQHRGVIRKRIMPIHFIDANGQEARQEVAPRAEIVDRVSKKKVGTVTTVLGVQGLGLMRLEAIHKDPSDLLVINLDDICVRPVKPKWWPSQWDLKNA